MPKVTRDPIQPVTVGLRRADREFIERMGVGENLGSKLRSVLDTCANLFDNIANKKGSILVYKQTSDEKIWLPNGDSFPYFGLEKKKGWSGIGETARAAGFVVQIIQDESHGTVEVWIAPGKRLNDCESCRARVQEAMR